MPRPHNNHPHKPRWSDRTVLGYLGVVRSDLALGYAVGYRISCVA